jgi:hypothetical protein
MTAPIRFRLRTLLVGLAARRWLTFSLRGLFALVTLFAVWLGLQVNWLRQRQDARRWIEQHESGEWSRADPVNVISAGIRNREWYRVAPWSLRLMGERRLVYVILDKSKLSEADSPLLDSLQTLFPEASGIHIEAPGVTYCWPPEDRDTFFKQ